MDYLEYRLSLVASDMEKFKKNKIMEIKPNEMEFIDEIATQITEEKFGKDTFEGIGELHFTDKAQDFYNERYDEVENLYIKLIKNK